MGHKPRKPVREGARVDAPNLIPVELAMPVIVGLDDFVATPLDVPTRSEQILWYPF